jgi:hypothetical protein
MVDTVTVTCLLVYFLLAGRFFYVFAKYQNKALNVKGLYDEEHKKHVVFKTMLFVRTSVHAIIAPLVAFFIPAYISVFWDGIDLKM